MRPVRHSQSGMTLLEVILATGIAVTIVTLMLSLSATATDESVYSEKSAAAVPLARLKVNEIESELLREGFQDGTETDEGDFGDQGWPNIYYEYKVEMVEEFDTSAIADINDRCLMGMLGDIEADAEGTPLEESTSETMDQVENQMMSQVMTFIPMVKTVFDRSLRKMTVTVYWNNDERKRPRKPKDATESFTVELYVFNSGEFEQAIAPFSAMLGGLRP